MLVNPDKCDVIAPNFKRRLSGVTSTIIRLVPLQSEDISIAATGPVLPDHVPQIRLRSLLSLSRRGPSGARVFHARRNVEMLAGLALRTVLRKKLKLLFTSASQRHHTTFSKWLIKRMDAIVATSAKTASYLDRTSTVVHHGIDTESFAPVADKAALRRSLNLPNKGILIGCYGRIRAQKGTDVYVDAMIKALANFPYACAIVMGRATEKHEDFEKQLKAKIQDARMADRILFLPEVPVWEMAKWYQVLDLYIAPQRWEGFGLTPLEAMSCGCPVIATRVGAFEELIEEGQTGTLIPPGDVEAMKAATIDLINDQPRLARWSAQSRTHVLENFRLQQEADTLNNIYRDLLNG